MLTQRLNDIHRFIDQGRMEDALKLLREASRSFPAHAPLFILLAETAEKVGRTDEALNAWQHAWFLVPNSTFIRRQIDRLLPPRPTRRADVRNNTDRADFNPHFERPQRLHLPVTQKIIPPPLPHHKPLVPKPPPLPKESAAPETFVAPTQEAPMPQPVLSSPEPLLETSIVEVNVDFEWAEPQPSALNYPEVSWHTLKEAFQYIEPPMLEPQAHIDTVFSNIDDLIAQLDQAPRIIPNPESIEVAVLPEDETDTEDMVSETLARIYTTQKQYSEAISVYKRLAKLQPLRADYFLKKVAELEGK
ncbi:MAG TPA: tetratricopeptide repeat protein [Rhodothermales bacterium]|nr:tetratricopeptide repeat protein [Rhodothermales bacterium]HRR08352.1 tetratricopeptide repeat protein [Rhodothermales bacterium]